MNTEPNKSAGGLLSDALGHVSSLVRSEVDLARAEVSENLNKAGVAIGMIVGAVVVALTALNVLSAALVGDHRGGHSRRMVGPDRWRVLCRRRLCDGKQRHQ